MFSPTRKIETLLVANLQGMLQVVNAIHRLADSVDAAAKQAEARDVKFPRQGGKW